VGEWGSGGVEEWVSGGVGEWGSGGAKAMCATGARLSGVLGVATLQIMVCLRNVFRGLHMAFVCLQLDNTGKHTFRTHTS
jgi:hypothetical protein